MISKLKNDLSKKSNQTYKSLNVIEEAQRNLKSKPTDNRQNGLMNYPKEINYQEKAYYDASKDLNNQKRDSHIDLYEEEYKEEYKEIYSIKVNSNALGYLTEKKLNISDK